MKSETPPYVTCVVGGQAGSEGKGQIAAYLANEYDIAVRVGAPNAGHSVKLGNKVYKFKQIPVASIVNPDCELCIGAGGLIDLKVLAEEMAWIPNIEERLIIDRNAAVMEDTDSQVETDMKLYEKIGSTSKGIGIALQRKMARDGSCKLASQVPELQRYIGNVAEHIAAKTDKKVMIEGTQGYELSLNHGPYPFCTSRDITSASLLSDTGVGPLAVDDVIMVVRTYPIRVHGNSGPMKDEIDWATVTDESGSPSPIVEKTTVTHRIRRVGRFDLEKVVQAAHANTPTQIALTFGDYLDFSVNSMAHSYEEFSPALKEMIHQVEVATEVPVTLVSVGFGLDCVVDMRSDYGHVTKYAV